MNEIIILELDALIAKFTDTRALLLQNAGEIASLKVQYSEQGPLFAFIVLLLEDYIQRLLDKAQILTDLIAKLEELKKKYSEPHKGARIIFYNSNMEEINKMDIQIDKLKNASIKIVDKGGNDAVVDGVPVWELDPVFCALVVAADGMSAQLQPTGALGSATLKVTADADMGAGVEEISGELLLAFLPGKAVGILSVTDPE